MARPPVFDSLVKARARELLRRGATAVEVANVLHDELAAVGQRGPSARWVSGLRRETAAVLVGETAEEQGAMTLADLVRITPSLQTGHAALYLGEGRTVAALSEAGFALVLSSLYRPSDLADLAEMVAEYPVPLPTGIAGDAVIERGRREREGAIALLLEAAEILRNRPLDERWAHWAKQSPEERAARLLERETAS